MKDALVGLGANLPSTAGGAPVETLRSALAHMDARGILVLRRSRWYRSRPVPPSDQPWFVNGVAAVQTDLAPAELLAVLHRIEADFGRIRQAAGEARPIDLDLLAFEDQVISTPPSANGARGLTLPHPEMHRRAFVLLPLAEIAPGWRHPVTGQQVIDLVDVLPADQVAVPIDGD
jgi:2-amino-4-hydroxy-6-hydroxymethyldihydropteridine diphosphokinase